MKNDTINIIDIAMKLMYEGKITEEDYTKITEATTYIVLYVLKSLKMIVSSNYRTSWEK